MASFSYQAVVVGGGPAGMTAMLYLLRSGLSVAWVEMLAAGGQVLMTEEVENYPGFPDGIKGYELAELFERQLDGFSYDMYRDELVELVCEKDGHRLLVGDKWIQAKAVIICSGASRKKLGIEGEEELFGHGVSYCALCDGNFLRNEDVVAIGGGNSALEESLYLARLVNKVYLVHRRDKFRGVQHYIDKVLAEPKIEILYDSAPVRFVGTDGLTGVEIENVHTKERQQIEARGAFVFIGSSARTGFLPATFQKDEEGFLITDDRMATNVKGVFAAGDCRAKSCRQIANAVGDGAVAAHSVSAFLDQYE